MVNMATSIFSIVTVCYQLDFHSDMYDPDLEHYQIFCFLKFYSTLGCIHLPRPEKYEPDNFADIFSPIELCV